MPRKRAHILPRMDVLREQARDPVVLTGTCQAGDRPAQQVLVTDLSAHGCKLQGDSVGVTKAEPVQLWIGEVGPIAAKLKWLKNGSFGLAFDPSLDAEVVRRLFDAAPAEANVLAMKRSAH